MKIRLTMLAFQLVFLGLNIYYSIIGNTDYKLYYGGLVLLMMVGILLSYQIEENKKNA